MIKLWGILKGLLIQDITDRTKQLSVEVDPAATTATRTTIKSAQTANRTINLPDADDTLVGKATADILTNKTIDGDNNTIQDVDLPSLKVQLADAGKMLERDGSGAVVSGHVAPGGVIVGDTDSQTLTNKTIDGTNATGTNTISADASDITNDATASSLVSTDQQAVNNELAGRLDTAEADKLDAPATHADNILIKTDGVDTQNSQATGISVDDSNNVTGVNDLTVDGDLVVNGTTTTLNTANLDVEDKNITVNKNGTDISSEGAGLTVERAGVDGSIVYEDALASKFKVGALGSEVEVADVSTAQIITNKDMSDSSNNIDTASADSLTRATGNQQVVTIPDTATPDNFLLEAQSQVVTNKDIDGGTASNTSRITLPKGNSAALDALTRKEGTVLYDTDLDTIVVDDGVNLNRIAGGESGTNYVPNSDGEAGVDGYNAYDDTNAVPTDGTGGSPSAVSVTPVVLAADVVRGNKSIGILKSAANGQGEGISIDLDPIDNADKNKALTISFDYKNIGVTPENYSSGDIRVYVYDIDNAALLTDQLNSDDGDIIFSENSSFLGSFYSTNSANYRLIFHVRTTNATAYALSVDNVKIAPVNTFVPASTKNELETNTLSANVTSNSTLTDLTFTNLEVGSVYELTGSARMVLDSGANDDAVRLDIFNGATKVTEVLSQLGDPDLTLSSNNYGVVTKFTATDTTLTFVLVDASANSYIQGNGTKDNTYMQLEKRNDLASNVVSNAQISQLIPTYNTVGVALPTGTIAGSFSNAAVFGTLESNFANAYNTTTGVWTAPKDGKVTFSGQFEIAYSSGSGVVSGIEFRDITLGLVKVRGIDEKQGTSSSSAPTCSGTFKVIKGNQYEIRSFCNGSSPSYSSGFSGSNFSLVYEADFSSYGVLNPNSDYVRVAAAPFSNLPNSSGYFDITSFELPIGEWDISISAVHRTLGTTPGLVIDLTTMIGTVAGNNSTGLLYGETGALTVTSGSRTWEALPTQISKTLTVTAPTTYYFKYGVSSAPAANSMRLDHYTIFARRVK